MRIDDLPSFLRWAMRLEAEAADGYHQLAMKLTLEGNATTAALMNKLGEYSRMHLKEVSVLALEHGLNPESPPPAEAWPDGVSPENPLGALPSTYLTPRQALQVALAAERRACDFYAVVAGQTRSAEVQELAQVFVEEESEHVDHLERWLDRLES